jgi:hypothetical protein
MNQMLVARSDGVSMTSFSVDFRAPVLAHRVVADQFHDPAGIKKLNDRQRQSLRQSKAPPTPMGKNSMKRTEVSPGPRT